MSYVLINFTKNVDGVEIREHSLSFLNFIVKTGMSPISYSKSKLSMSGKQQAQSFKE